MAEKHKCDWCGRGFDTYRGLAMHRARWCSEPVPAPAPPPPPKKKTDVSLAKPYSTTLINGRGLSVGDVVYFTQKAVIKKITYTDGSKDTPVECEIVTDTWSQFK